MDNLSVADGLALLTFTLHYASDGKMRIIAVCLA